MYDLSESHSSSQFCDRLTISLSQHSFHCVYTCTHSLLLLLIVFLGPKMPQNDCSPFQINICSHKLYCSVSLSPCPLPPVVLCFREAQHRQRVQLGLVCRWHPTGRGLWQRTCHLCPCGGAALGVEELCDYPYQEENHAGRNRSTHTLTDTHTFKYLIVFSLLVQ